jgi:hypothetical protein
MPIYVRAAAYSEASRVERNGAHIISTLLREVRTFSKRPFAENATLAH